MFVMDSISAQTYRSVHELTPLPTTPQFYLAFGQQLMKQRKDILNLEDPSSLAADWRIENELETPDSTTVILATDAAAFEAEKVTPSIAGTNCNSAFVSNLQSVNPELSDFIAHVKAP
jgi:hypothetical protein